jgi:dTDP-3-amino-3,4,6-trideoxy-alpha-D-glucose transaminase
LYGQPADMEALTSLASNHGLAIVGDCCQAHLATAARQPVGAIGAGAAFSFYPTKNLGALGDGGAVVTNDRSLADRIRRLRNGGQTDRYRHQEAGVNSRLDEVQAAILRARLPFLPAWTERRRALAAAYRTGLSGTSVQLPVEADRGHAYHLFVVRSKRRDDLRAHLQQRGIETLVHYPIPIPEQPALAATQPARCPRAAQACAEVLSLPLYPALTDSQVAEVVGAVREFR